MRTIDEIAMPCFSVQLGEKRHNCETRHTRMREKDGLQPVHVASAGCLERDGGGPDLTRRLAMPVEVMHPVCACSSTRAILSRFTS
ncbi:hypothetical protein L484_020269 [Morus notabilis]|uniref:Uncharacterized protein n=1 Tax=Morus notabilis TaxID=981085 RepID=W9R2X7_9ROSA|nr:hypothetical protein L484_020269 [Morus notabilis]